MLPHLFEEALSVLDTEMAQLLKLAQHSCERGDLTVFEHILPGTLKRVFYITNADGSTRSVMLRTISMSVIPQC